MKHVCRSKLFDVINKLVLINRKVKCLAMFDAFFIRTCKYKSNNILLNLNLRNTMRLIGWCIVFWWNRFCCEECLIKIDYTIMFGLQISNLSLDVLSPIFVFKFSRWVNMFGNFNSLLFNLIYNIKFSKKSWINTMAPKMSMK